MNKHGQPFSQRRVGPAKAVKALLLTFEYHDLNGSNGQKLLDDETTLVNGAFTRLWGRDAVTEERIPMYKPREWLTNTIRAFLPTASEEVRDTLYIVYYHGHGYRNEKGGFTLLSHKKPSSKYMAENKLPDHDEFWNKVRSLALSDSDFGRKEWNNNVKPRFKHLQPPAEVVWEHINDPIMKARCDTLVILDCCDAGLAAVTDTMLRANLEPHIEGCPDLWSEFRKELLGACSWGNSTWDRMSPSLVKVLTTAEDLWRPPRRGEEGENGRRMISLSTLVRLMNIELVREWKQRRADSMEKFPQAVHYQLRRTRGEPIALERLSDHLDIPMAGLQV